MSPREIVKALVEAVAPPSPEPAPTGPSLTSADASERARAVELERAAAEARRDRRVRELEQAIADAREGCVTTIADAMRTAADARDKLDAALVADLTTTIDPIVETLSTSPRAAAVALADAWRRFDDRARREIGAELDDRHLVHSFARVLGQEDRAGDLATVDGAYRFVKSIMAGDGPATLEEWLRTFERGAEVAIRSGRPGTRDRFAVASSSASASVARARIVLHDAERTDRDRVGHGAHHERLTYARRLHAEAHGLPVATRLTSDTYASGRPLGTSRP